MNRVCGVRAHLGSSEIPQIHILGADKSGDLHSFATIPTVGKFFDRAVHRSGLQCHCCKSFGFPILSVRGCCVQYTEPFCRLPSRWKEAFL